MKKTDEYPRKVQAWTREHWSWLSRNSNFDGAPAYALRSLTQGATVKQMRKRTADYMLSIVVKTPPYQPLQVARRAVEDIGKPEKVTDAMVAVFIEGTMRDILREKVASWQINLRTQ